MRLKLRPSNPETLQDWAFRAAPLYEAAKDAILDGNAVWGEVLNAEQKQVHDRDLSAMAANFRNVTGTLNTWMDGKGKMPVPPVQPDRNPALATQTPAATGSRVSEHVAPIKKLEIEDNWVAYVNTFIKAYKLDERQKNAAREGILPELLAKAKTYRKKNKAKFIAVEAELEGQGSKARQGNLLSRLREINKRRRELRKPIHDLFGDLDRRLKTLPTSEQQANVDPKLQKKLEKDYKMLSGQTSLANKPGKAASRTRQDTSTESSKKEPASAEPAKGAEGQPSGKSEAKLITSNHPNGEPPNPS